jgi:hypothetical protein
MPAYVRGSKLCRLSRFVFGSSDPYSSTVYGHSRKLFAKVLIATDCATENALNHRYFYRGLGSTRFEFAKLRGSLIWYRSYVRCFTTSWKIRLKELPHAKCKWVFVVQYDKMEHVVKADIRRWYLDGYRCQCSNTQICLLHQRTL